MNLNNKSRSFRWFAVFPVITLGLGTWQVYRYQWKKDLIDKAKLNVEKEPITLNENVVKSLLTSSKDSSTVGANQLEFRRVELKGQYLNSDNEIHLGPRTNDGNIGYYVITPFRLDGDSNDEGSSTTILVNRGWLPTQKIKSKDYRNNLNNKYVEIEGLIGKSKESGSIFTPDNVPSKNQWYYVNAEDMAQTTGVASPIIVNTLNETITNDKKLTRDFNQSFKRFNTDVESNFYNKHMSYIFTWYTLTGCLSFIYLKYMRNVPLKK